MRGLGVRRGSCRFREPRDDHVYGKTPDRNGGQSDPAVTKNVLLHMASKLAATNLVGKSCETFKGNAKARIRALALCRLVDLANDLDLLARVVSPQSGVVSAQPSTRTSR